MFGLVIRFITFLVNYMAVRLLLTHNKSISLVSLMQAFKTNNSKCLLQNTLYRSRSFKTMLMALGLVLSYAPVSTSDVTLSTQGTYFQNDAQGRK